MNLFEHQFMRGQLKWCSLYTHVLRVCCPDRCQPYVRPASRVTSWKNSFIYQISQMMPKSVKQPSFVSEKATCLSGRPDIYSCLCSRGYQTLKLKNLMYSYFKCLVEKLNIYHVYPDLIFVVWVKIRICFSCNRVKITSFV